MGFRSTLVSEHYGHTLPTWFIKKYKYIANPEGTLITSHCEFKMYSGNEIFEDYQKALIEAGLLKDNFTVHVVVMAEDSTVTKVVISKNDIKYYSMVEQYEVDHIWNQGY